MCRYYSVSFWAVLLMFLGSAFLLPSEELLAQPQHIRGSANVAVAGYVNSRGSFVLWANGRISSVSGRIANESWQYSAAPNMKRPEMVSGQCLGAPKVAVSAFVDASGTYVVFSDGSVKKPQNGDAAAGSSSFRFVAGTVLAEGPGYIGGSSEPQFETGFTRSVSNFNNEYVSVHIKFDKPFEKKPVVVYARSVRNMNTQEFGKEIVIVSVSSQGFEARVRKLDGAAASGFYFVASGQ